MQSEEVGMPSLDGIEDVRASEIYPKKPVYLESSSCSIPYELISGESPTHCGTTNEGTIVISSYRLYVSANPFINIPLGLIEHVECRDICDIYIYCKDARFFKCRFSNNEKCQNWLKWIQDAVAKQSNLDDNHFSFVFYMYSGEKADHMTQLRSRDPVAVQDMRSEAQRMGFDLDRVWKISTINSDYSFCPSYPRQILVPASVPDEDLKVVANFRYSKRIPAVVWRHQKNGCVIARCSQPEIGIFYARRQEDENLIQLIADACRSDPGHEEANSEKQETYSLKSDVDEESPNQYTWQNSTEKVRNKLLIIDARSYTVATANRAKGGGSECEEYYTNCEVQFLGLANIHNVRKSFFHLRNLASSQTSDQQTWLSSLEKTNWFQYISNLIRSALLIVTAIDMERRPVVVHCSDGWDRTPQIVSLAELMMDPYYRTKEGFKVLVEREWLEFGHKFADRCGHTTGTSDTNERSPVFLQWLDCVHQLLHQFPCYFEFNDQFLVKLALHTYSCLFGTFMCNSDRERRFFRIHERTISVWPLLNNSTYYHNFLFNKSAEVLNASSQIKDLHFWSDVYMPGDGMSLGRPTIPLSVAPYVEEVVTIVKTKSCDDIPSIDHPPGLQRRSSDPSIVKNACQSSDDCAPTTFSKEDSSDEPVCSAGPSGESLDTNGNVDNVNGFAEGHSTRTKCKSKSVSCSNLVAREPTIDGSTDTLVSENGIIPGVPTVEKAGSSHSDGSVPLSRISCTVSTSTSDLVSQTDNSEEQIPPHLENVDISKWTPWAHAFVDACMASKKASSSSSCSYNTPHHSRTPSSGFPATPCDDVSDVRGCAFTNQSLGIDGLVIVEEEIQQQVQKLILDYKRKMKSIKNELAAARNDIMQQICFNCRAREMYLDGDDAGSSADSVCSGEQRIEGSPGSDVSWEQLEPLNPILWVPDHAVTHCTGCEAKFWTVKRRHHCRKCGQVFCSNCSSQMMPVPTEQLFHPVRVCNYCYMELQPRESCDKMPKAVITAASN